MVSGAVRDRSLEWQEKGFGEERAHPRRIEPGRGAGCSDEGDGPAHAELAKQIAELSREARQNICVPLLLAGVPPAEHASRTQALLRTQAKIT